MVLLFLSKIIGLSFFSKSPEKGSVSPVSINDPRRKIYLLSINGQTYYIKIAEFEYKEMTKEKLGKMDITDANLGQYVYEARIYEELNKQMKNRVESQYITQIYGWGIEHVGDDDRYFYINVKPKENGEEKKYKLDILGNLDRTKSYSYIITENDSKYIPLSELYQNVVMDINEVYDNGVNLLNKCFEKCGFVHWDFHHGNILCNPATNQVKLFDFDLSELDYVDNEENSKRSVSWKDSPYGDALLDLAIDYKPENIDEIEQAKYAGRCYDYYRLLAEQEPYANIVLPKCKSEHFKDEELKKGQYKEFEQKLIDAINEYKDTCFDDNVEKINH